MKETDTERENEQADKAMNKCAKTWIDKLGKKKKENEWLKEHITERGLNERMNEWIIEQLI